MKIIIISICIQTWQNYNNGTICQLHSSVLMEIWSMLLFYALPTFCLLFCFASFCLITLVILYHLCNCITNQAKSIINTKNGTAECLSVKERILSFVWWDTWLMFLLSVSVQTLTSPFEKVYRYDYETILICLSVLFLYL